MPPKKRTVDERPAFRLQPDKLQKHMAMVQALITTVEPSAANNDELADAIATIQEFHKGFEKFCQLSSSSIHDLSTSSSTPQTPTDSADTGNQTVQNFPTDLNTIQQSEGWKFLEPVEYWDQRRWLKIGENLLEMCLWSWSQMRKTKSR